MWNITYVYTISYYFYDHDLYIVLADESAYLARSHTTYCNFKRQFFKMNHL